MVVVCYTYLAWNQRRISGAGVALPIFCNHLLFCNQLQVGDVSISFASSKSWVSPLKVFVKFRDLIIFPHQAFIICQNGQSLKMLIEVIRQKIVSKVILAFLDDLKPRIFFVGQPWWPTESGPFFKVSGSMLEWLYLFYLNFLLYFLFVQIISTFF